MNISWNQLLKALLLAICLMTGALARATPTVIYSSGNVATGIQGLVVDGTTYDVSFVFGSYNSVFASSTPSFLGNYPGANAATNALMDVLDAEASVTFGTSSLDSAVLWVVFNDENPLYGSSSDYFLAAQTGYNSGGGADWQRFGDFTATKDADYSNQFNWAFAVFQIDERTIPEPSSLALVGLAMLGLVRRRRAH